jgi:hypothetical protein
MLFERCECPYKESAPGMPDNSPPLLYAEKQKATPPFMNCVDQGIQKCLFHVS